MFRNRPFKNNVKVLVVCFNSVSGRYVKWSNLSGLRCRHPLFRAHQEWVRNIISTLYLLTRGREWVREPKSLSSSSDRYSAQENQHTYLLGEVNLPSLIVEHLQQIQYPMDSLPKALIDLRCKETKL